MRHILVFISLFTFHQLVSQAYEAPVLHCLQGDGNDDVTLHWIPPTSNAAQFTEYRLYRQEQFFDDNFAIVADINTSTFLDLGASADEAEIYFIEAVYDSAGVELVSRSNSLHLINLMTDGFQNQAQLDWNLPTVEALDSIYTAFVVQINHTGVWQSVDTLAYPLTSYTYISQVCPEPPAIDVDIDFRVLLLSTLGCTSVSNWKDNVTPLYDNNPPTPPLIETVTVDTALQRARICWFPSPEGDVQGYRVLNVNEEQVAITTDPTVLDAVDPLSNIVLGSQGYLIVARDTCGGNETSGDESIPHFTLHLDLEFFTCDQAVRVSWNEYRNWEGGVDSYVVYGGLEGTTPEVLDTVPGDQLSYLHEGVPLDVDYIYLVKALAVNGYKPSLSPRTGIFTAYPQVPAFTYLANVNVIASSQVELKVLAGPSAQGTRFRFERLGRFGDTFDILGIRNSMAVDIDGFIPFIDAEGDPASRINEYRVSVIDSCGNIASVTDTCVNIRSRIDVDNSQRQNYISWNPYVNWDGGVLNYNVYQVIDGEVGALLATVPADIFHYEDEVDSIQDYLRDGTYCYIVEAVEGVNAYGEPQRSFSNVICGAHEPLMFIPNAITPNGDGLNDTFAPVAGYFDRVDGYDLKIYDRWGGLVYETQDYYRPWKASDANGQVQEGVYVYHLRLTTGDGRVHERYGNITVILPEGE